MRLFVALRPSPEFRDALTALQENLRAGGVTGRWLSPENLHLTLAFVGQRPDPEGVFNALPKPEEPFDIALSHPGVFPEADVLWAGTAPSRALDSLARRVRDGLSEAGIPFDQRAFVPHITLARKPRVPEGVRLNGWQVPPAAMTVREVCLYKSERGENGMVYTVIGSVPGKAGSGL